ncbi:MAG: alpha-hydroxy acid oxidase [Bacteroidota bacterium]
MSYAHHREKWMNQYPAIQDLARRAQQRIPFVSWEYLESGTSEETLVDKNREALHRITFKPQFCKGILTPRVETELFGQAYAAPFGIAPIGLTGLMWPRVECYLAAAAQAYRIPYTLSTVATETPETVGPIAGDMGWFQLYPPKDMDVCKSLLTRAWEAGFRTVLVTADVPMASRRERTKRAGLQMPPKISADLVWQALTHPRWTAATLSRGLPSLRTIEAYVNYKNMKFVSGYAGNRLGGTLDWDYCQFVKEHWPGTVVLKGVLHPRDAEKAVEVGLDGVQVSNHGGRQFDGASAAIDALPAIVAAVGNKTSIIFDSGLRTGLDIVRALALGADFVMLGRAFVYGVAALGQYGGHHAIEILLDDLQNNMVQLGVDTVAEIRELEADY